MKSLTILLFLAFFSFNLFSAEEVKETPNSDVPPTAFVTRLRGEVLFDGRLIKEGETIEKPGKINTKDKSFVQLKIDKWKNTISIGPNSHMVLDFNDNKKYTLESGMCRWRSFAESLSKGKIHTRNVAMGVRGTDFFLKTNSLLGETEVIMFDGEVLMENLKDKDNTAVLTKGQWGGIGGRFGEKIAPVLNLPKELLDTTEKILE